MAKERSAYVIICLALIVTAILALMLGTQFYSLPQLWQALLGNRPAVLSTVLTFRLPRVLAAMIAGGMLASAGAISQAVFRNRLADPTILGVTSAGELFMLLGGMVLPAFIFQKQLLALLGGLVAFALLANRKTLRQPYQLIIVGVALNLTFMALTQLFTKGINVSSSLGFNGITWSSVYSLLITGFVGLVAVLLMAPWANDLKLSDEQLASVGVPVTDMRLGLLVLVVYLSADVTAAVGTIPFIGIIVPNIARYFVGHDYQTILPFSMLSGAWLLLVVDTIGRLVVLPSELSAATIMAVLGGPFLIILVQRGGFHGIKAR
ncbi:iron ABC transporter permease protein [Secundilactobacillus pentosiphilus]|uniref:Probable heme-iron transport system permease protein IsdF n=1 Tax=Secundilactobacillus pentosiphilus TaxID=1714682 RepID=A0A1Z5IVG6_9LACO|nr:iron ABC transporter permease [Secundilactobacillus pentosiphilus]GAX05755.1 iron ABC transporter permease protein [Secundilactobacillus pentosiphilus]